MVAHVSLVLGTSLSVTSCVDAPGDTDSDAFHESDTLDLVEDRAGAYNPVSPLQRVYSLYHASTTDQLLTLSKAQYDSLPNTGWTAQPGEVFYLERQPQATTLPLRRFSKGAPQREHFYTTSNAEADYVKAQGWIDEGNIGHIYSEQVPGAVPLHRLVRWDGGTMDLVHRYTVSTAVVNTLKAQGYTYEKVTGYVSTSPTPQVSGGHVFGTRVGCSSANDLDCSFGLFRAVSSTTRPNNTQMQVMRFKLWTPDMFTTVHGPAEDHLLFVPRGILQPNFTDLTKSKIHGLGLIVGAGGGGFGCGNPDGIDKPFIEEWWPLANPSPTPGVVVWNGNNYVCPSGIGSCDRTNTCGASKLKNRTWYDVTVSVSDTGDAYYTIHESGVLRAKGSAKYGSVSKYPAQTPFNQATKGYFLHSAPALKRDHTAYITNLSVTWE